MTLPSDPMDQPLAPRRHQRLVIALAIAALLAAAAAALYALAPRGLQVAAADVRTAAVTRGLFRDELAVRATALPLHTVMLDAVESGRVEEVLARDGAMVARGEVLFRLSNPQRRLEVLAREAEHAQQISNLTNLRVSLEASRTGRLRRSADLAYALTQANKQHRRNEGLAQQGFVSRAALEESADLVTHQRRALDTEQAGNAVEDATQRDALRQMEQAIARMEAGLRFVHSTVDALAVRAPVAGRLADFRLQVGQTVKPDQHLGRIDDASRFKLAAQVDEYYLQRVAPGLRGKATLNGRTHGVAVSRVFPQISDGRFAVELAFDADPALALHPGQGLELAITLGGSTEALLLPNDAWVNDGGGAWAFVLASDGSGAERRAIRTGRRNNAQVEVLSGLAAGERVLVSSYASFGTAQRLQLAR
ncbi:MAG TPA: efflux RND transporter periplasmic adaptor subunit [Telluria sp.]